MRDPDVHGLLADLEILRRRLRFTAETWFLRGVAAGAIATALGVALAKGLL